MTVTDRKYNLIIHFTTEFQVQLGLEFKTQSFGISQMLHLLPHSYTDSQISLVKILRL